LVRKRPRVQIPSMAQLVRKKRKTYEQQVIVVSYKEIKNINKNNN
jgi:hypothetical protein